MSLVGKIIYVMSPHKWGRGDQKVYLDTVQETIQSLPPECSRLPPAMRDQLPYSSGAIISRVIHYPPQPLLFSGFIASGIGIVAYTPPSYSQQSTHNSDK